MPPSPWLLSFFVLQCVCVCVCFFEMLFACCFAEPWMHLFRSLFQVAVIPKRMRKIVGVQKLSFGRPGALIAGLWAAFGQLVCSGSDLDKF